MNLTIANLVSKVFQPLLIPIYSLFVILYSFPFHYQYIPDKRWNVTIATIIMMTTVFPALIIYILEKLNLVGDEELSEQKKSILPYLIFFFFYLMAFLTFRPKTVSSIVFMEDPLIATMLLGATLALGIMFFINNFTKVSPHANASANLFMFSCLLARYTQKNLFFIIVIALVMIGLVGSSRLYLKANTKKELYAGYTCGIIGQVFAFLLYFASYYTK
jgi:membrane-associated phospholipid phosphatase